MRRAPFVIFALVMSCRETVPAPIDAAPEDIVIVAVTSPGGVVTSVERLARGDGQALLAPRDSIVVPFVIRAGDLVDPFGAPLSEDTLDELIVRAGGREPADDPGAGACGRCLAPAGRAPQRVFPGDSCRLPLFVEVAGDVDAALAAQAREQIRLDWPGACPCQRHDPQPTPRVDMRPVAPAEDPWPIERIAQDVDGTLAMVSEHMITVVRPDGARTQRTKTGGPWCERRSNDLPFVGPIHAAIYLADGQLLVASHDAADAGRRQVHVFDRALNFQRIQLTPPQLDPREFRRLDGSDSVFALGTVGLNTPTIHRCDADLPNAELRCSTFTPADFLHAYNGRPLTVALPDGALVAAGNPRGFAYGRLSEGQGGWRSSEFGRYPDTQGSSAAIRNVLDMAVVGQRVVTCGLSDTEIDRSVIMTATVTDALLANGDEPQWRVVFVSTEHGRCRGISEVPGQPNARRFVFTNSDGVDIDVLNDRVVAMHVDINQVAVLGERRRVHSLRTLRSGSAIATDATGSVFARFHDAGETDFRRLYGPTDGDATTTSVVHVTPEGFQTYGSGGRTRGIKFDLIRNDVETSRGTLSGFLPNEEIVAVARNQLDGTLLVAGHQSRFDDSKAFLRVVSNAETRDLDVESLVGLDARMIGAVEAGPGVFVVAAERGVLFRVEGDALTPIPVFWDDPFTEEVETQRRDTRCDAVTSHQRQETALGPFRALDVAHGVVWVVGCEGTVLRVMPFGERPYAERISIARGPQTLYRPPTHPPDVTAVHAFCPDNVLFGTDAVNEIDSDRGRIFEVVSNPPPDNVQPVVPIEDVALRAYPPNTRGGVSLDSLSAGYPLDFLGSGTRISVVYAMGREVLGRFDRFFGEDSFRMSEAFWSAGQDDEGNVVIGLGRGRVLYGRQCPP